MDLFSPLLCCDLIGVGIKFIQGRWWHCSLSACLCLSVYLERARDVEKDVEEVSRAASVWKHPLARALVRPVKWHCPLILSFLVEFLTLKLLVRRREPV